VLNKKKTPLSLVSAYVAFSTIFKLKRALSRNRAFIRKQSVPRSTPENALVFSV
jgi:hypothetical protein